jgi:hypothetical protein
MVLFLAEIIGGLKMKAQRLVELLTQQFGDRVKVRSQYHIQVDSDKGPHNIWLKQTGELKFQFYGDRKVQSDVSFDWILSRIKLQKHTDVDELRNVLSVTKFIEHSEKAAKQTDKAVIFTDAGFKNGKARIAAVRINNVEGTVEARSIIVLAKDVVEAEKLAIHLGLGMVTDIASDIKVYNDNQTAVALMRQVADGSRVEWLPREKTKIADSLGNMRHK